MIPDQCQLELKENQDFNLITDAAVLKINETGKIRELCRALSEIPATATEKELKAKQEVANEWKAIEEIQVVNIDGQIDQLEALRFKMKLGNFNLPSPKVRKFRKSKCLECEKSERRNVQEIWGCG